MSRKKRVVIPTVGDLVICLDTGSIGLVMQRKREDEYLVSFPHGTYLVVREDFDVLKSGGREDDYTS